MKIDLGDLKTMCGREKEEKLFLKPQLTFQDGVGVPMRRAIVYIHLYTVQCTRGCSGQYTVGSEASDILRQIFELHSSLGPH